MPQDRLLRDRLVFLEQFASLRLDHTLAMLGHYQNVQAQQMLLEHRHRDLMEICYLARGRQVYRVAGKDYALRAGEIFITFPGEQHSSGGKPQEKGELFWMQLRLPRRGRFLNLPAGEARGLVDALRNLPARHFPARPAVAGLFPRLFLYGARAIQRQKLEGLDRIELCNAACELLIEVARSAQASGQTPRQDADVNRAIAFVAAHVAEPIGVPDIAEALGLSPSWFKAKFRRAMGMPPGEYVLRAKVDRAKPMLQAGRKVTDIAFDLGFSSSQYFATVFRRFTGVTPRQSRA